MLGSSAHTGGALDNVVVVAPLEVSLAAAKRRVDIACDLAEHIAEFSLPLTPPPVRESPGGDRRRPTPPPKQPLPQALHMCWMLLHKTVAAALSYDAGLVDPQALRALSDRLSETIHHAVHTMVGGSWTPHANTLLQIAPELSGF